jgi:hypothetical protein
MAPARFGAGFGTPIPARPFSPPPRTTTKPAVGCRISPDPPPARLAGTHWVYQTRQLFFSFWPGARSTIEGARRGRPSMLCSTRREDLGMSSRGGSNRACPLHTARSGKPIHALYWPPRLHGGPMAEQEKAQRGPPWLLGRPSEEHCRQESREGGRLGLGEEVRLGGSGQRRRRTRVWLKAGR